FTLLAIVALDTNQTSSARRWPQHIQSAGWLSHVDHEDQRKSPSDLVIVSN
ncbi:MAG: hypothetical protein ACI92Z_002500, partial [Paracoccaceae bacterium]